MAISKVILNGETQMDVTPDTVTPEVMVEGYTALKNNGVRAVGTFVPNEGTVTEVATGTGLTGGPITSSGTIKADLVSETKLSNAATAATETSGRVYPVAVDKNGKLAVNVPWENSTYTPASTAPKMDGTAAVGTSAKYAREDHVHPSDTSRVPTTRTVNGKALSSNISLTASDVSAIATSAKGVAGGVAELDSNGLVPTSQLPSFVDDVLEYLSKSSFPATGETGKIYVDTTTNLTYRWSGTAYVEISPSLALGTTSSTAFRGDYGNAAYAHAVTNKGSAFTSGLYKITTNSEGHVTAATAVSKADITALGIPGSDTNTWNAMTGATSSANGTVGYVNAVPPKDGYNTKYLRADGTWSVPPDNNTWTAMTGATSSANGTVGYVNAVPPKDGYNTKYLRADGTWTVPPDNNTKYGLSISGHTVSLVEGGTTASVTVPDNNDNNAVTQTATSTSANYEVLFSATADNTTRTEGARKNNNLTFNPNTGNLQVTQINGVTVGSSPKFTDTDTNTKYGLSISGHTVSLVEGGTTASVTVPDNNDNNAVTQTATTTNAAYEVLFSATADNTTRTEGARKNSNMTFNPSTGNLAVTQINGVTVGSSPKFTDNNTTYSAGTGLSLSGTTFNHSNSVTAGTAGTSSATSGRSIAVPYITYDAQGHITASGTHTHTASVPPSGVVRGDDSTVGGLDPVTAAYIPTAASNKSFGLPAAAITIEYSTDGGSTWTSYGATDEQKKNLFNESRASSFYLGKATAKANNTVNNRLRVTIEPTDRYCSFHGIYVWFSTQGNTTVMDLERSTIGAKDTFTTVFTGQALSGWSGNNIRYFAYGTFGGGSTQTSNTYKYRITFRQTAINANYASSVVMDIRFLGDNLWSNPSDAYAKNMLNYRTPYSTDASGNVTFPAEVTATDFNGTVNGYSIAASVPSGAKFTDTKYTANTTSIGSASGWSAGTAPSLSYTSRSIPNVTSVGSKPSLSYTARSIPNVTSVGSVPSLSYTARSVGSASGWSAGTAASASVSNGVLTITNGTAPSLTVTSVACDDITAWDAGSTPTLGTAISADDITAWDAGSTPTLGTAISADDITAWSAGSVPSLTVTSTTVATGITAS